MPGLSCKGLTKMGNISSNISIPKSSNGIHLQYISIPFPWEDAILSQVPIQRIVLH